ncbi:hypothetical protein ONZ45_g7857 [Pleurotus djamor]|nr:hypothetical protein ONZ45_g7857 [Pleurotus djamor]
MPPITQFLDTSPTIEEVRRKIEALRADIRTLEGYCNARLLVISRLPSEVLSIIFEYVAILGSPLYSKPYAGWLGVTQVCRLWRDVAINSPRLWNTMYSHSKLDLAKLFLERSKSAPLYIKTLDSYPNVELLGLWFSHASRLKGIQLKYSHYRSTWTPLFNKLKAPNLETLDLQTSDITKFELTTEVDADHVPPLRDVKLSNCYFDLHNPFLSQLRTLHIQYNHYATPTPMLEVMFALKEMQHLESLELIHLLQFSDDVPGDLLVELSRLKDFKIGVIDPRVVLMLRSFVCPRIQSIVADTTEKVASEALAKQVTGAFYSIFPNMTSPTKLQLSLERGKMASAVVVEMDSVLDMTVPPTAVPPVIESPRPSQLTLYGLTDYSVSLAMLSMSPDGQPKVLECNLGQGYHNPIIIDRDVLITFMRALTFIETLVTPSLQDLAVILSDVPNKTQVNKSRRGPALPFSLPSLKRCYVTSYVAPNRRDSSLKNLRKALERRNHIKAGIEVLRLTDSFPQSDMEFLKPEVESFEYTSYNGKIVQA